MTMQHLYTTHILQGNFLREIYSFILEWKYVKAYQHSNVMQCLYFCNEEIKQKYTFF